MHRSHNALAFASLAAALALSPALCVRVAAAAEAPAWCGHLPLPRSAQLPAMTVNGETIHTPQSAECRPADVRTPHGAMHLAVAATEPRREHGLMNVPYVPAGEGMLFAFPGGDQDLHFWMKDTIAPLDMIFINGDGTITSIAADVPATKPGTPDDKLARRNGTGRFVIELGAGDAARLGLAPGQRLVLPSIEPE
jgi:uncharacterized membrane protein (UPF0127 family)